MRVADFDSYLEQMMSWWWVTSTVSRSKAIVMPLAWRGGEDTRGAEGLRGVSLVRQADQALPAPPAAVSESFLFLYEESGWCVDGPKCL